MFELKRVPADQVTLPCVPFYEFSNFRNAVQRRVDNYCCLGKIVYYGGMALPCAAPLAMLEFTFSTFINISNVSKAVCCPGMDYLASDEETDSTNSTSTIPTGVRQKLNEIKKNNPDAAGLISDWEEKVYPHEYEKVEHLRQLTLGPNNK